MVPMPGYASLHGSDEADLIDTGWHGSRADFIVAGNGADTVVAGGGHDTVMAGTGNDLVYAGSGHDEADGDAGRDTIYGGLGRDRLDGGAGEDVLFGEGGTDSLIGGAAADQLTGGGGDDVLTGDGPGASPGADTFYFDSNFGDDIITDFDLSRDVLEIRGGINGSAITSPADLAPLVTEAQGDAVILFANGDSITLEGITRDDLLADLEQVIRIV
jgi:Ca2+-binding RTX toxin-like protein